jgi:hypothetical protein
MSKKKRQSAGYGTLTSAVAHLNSAIDARDDDLFALGLVNRFVIEARAAKPVGRPKKAKGTKRYDEVAAYAAVHGEEKTRKDHNLTKRTYKEYIRLANKNSG